MGRFGLEPGLRAVLASLLCLRRAGLSGGTKYRFTGPAHPQRRLTESTYSSGWSTDPWWGLSRHSQVWSPSAAPSSASPRASTPGALVVMHLKQPVLDARVSAGGDDALDLRALFVAIVGCDVAGGRGAAHAWRHLSQKERCAKGVRVQPRLRRAEEPGSGRQLVGEWRQGV